MSNISFRNVRKKSNFTQVNNELLWNPELTLQAKGLLSIFLSNSDEWQLNMKEIIKRSKNGRDAHYKIVNELIEIGYFARVELLNDKFQFKKMIYLFSDNQSDIEEEIKNIENKAKETNENILIEYKDRNDKSKPKKQDSIKTVNTENPLTENQDVEKKPLTENQDAENRDAENQYINNTNYNNTNYNNTNLEEEEENNINTENEKYQTLKDFLLVNNIDQKTTNQTVTELKKRGITSFDRKDVLNQFEYMMNKVEHNFIDSHKNFAVYFANGLELQKQSRKANEVHQITKEKERQRKAELQTKRDTSIYFNWLEGDD